MALVNVKNWFLVVLSLSLRLQCLAFKSSQLNIWMEVLHTAIFAPIWAARHTHTLLRDFQNWMMDGVSKCFDGISMKELKSFFICWQCPFDSHSGGN